MNESDHDAMVRWQGESRELRSTVNSLFLTYAAAMIGGQSSILFAKEVTRVGWAWIFIIAGCGALLSLAFGFSIVLVRLKDARLTARIARYRVEQKNPSEIKPLRNTTEKLGLWTNRLIPCQIVTFVLATIAFLIWIVLSFGTKLSFTAG